MASSWFEVLLKAVLEHEGGSKFTDIKGDAGGATKWGVSLRFLRSRGLIYDLDGDGDVDADDVRALTYEDARRIYQVEFWDAGNYEALGYGVGGKAFDTAVNTGIPRANKLLQQTAADLGASLEVDGVIGPASRRAILTIQTDEFLSEFCANQAEFYLGLIAKKPDDLTQFRKGWLRRAAWTPNAGAL